VSSPAVLPQGQPPTGQVAFVTGDLEAQLRRFLDLGVGPWNVWTFDDRMLRTMTYAGRPGRFSARVALCSAGPLTYEVIEPVTGPSIWHDFLEARGPGMHHLGYYVDDIEGAIAAMAEKGYAAVQSGSGFGVDGDGAFAYFDTTDAFGCYMEAIVGPRALPPPQAHLD
jgi:methylmalonyl-CoA/ethylmalonyl-CoA epimerase